MSVITPKIAVDWIRAKEPIAAARNFHLGLTGSVLFKGFSEKDFDVIAYPHNPNMPHDKKALLLALGLGMDARHVESFENYADKDYGRCVAITKDPATGLRVDVLFME